MPEWVEDLTGRVPLGGKMGIPEKVADTVVILSPPEAGIRVGPIFDYRRISYGDGVLGKESTHQRSLRGCSCDFG